ncbi:hypothetical protein B0H14DRAFT_3740936 [Mycena olivaceomarginata]|nr:hypothetical protein B0H14DRAFT_3740936 [Mycena olivaceomarginata]
MGKGLSPATVLGTPELIDLIVGLLSSSQDLKSCALLCRLFTYPAQSRPFHSITTWAPEDGPEFPDSGKTEGACRLRQTLASLPHLRPMVRHVSVPLDEEFLTEIAGMEITSLRSISFNFPISSIDSIGGQASALARSLLQLPCIRKVALGGAFSSIEALQVSLNFVPLSQLQAHISNIEHDASRDRHVDSQVTCRRGKEGGEERWQGGVGRGRRRYAAYGNECEGAMDRGERRMGREGGRGARSTWEVKEDRRVGRKGGEIARTGSGRGRRVERRGCAIARWAGKERRDGTRRETRGKEERSGAEMGKKRGGDGTKGEEAKEERAKKGDTREGVSEWIWKAQQHGLVVRPRNERRVHVVVRRRLNRGASVEGRVRCAWGACESPRGQEQWHRILRLGRRRRCGVGVQAAAYAEGTEKSVQRCSSGETR